MASITIRDVPDDALAELAARSGRSMQEYLRLMLVEIAAVPDREEVLARARRRVARTGTRLTGEEIISAWGAGRR